MRIAAAATALALSLIPTPAEATDGGCWDTAPRCHDLEAIHGPLDQQRALQDNARAWAHELAASGVLRHSTDGTDGYSEIVGMAPDWQTVITAWLDSPAHREILLDLDLREVGIGVADGGSVNFYVVQFR